MVHNIISIILKYYIIISCIIIIIIMCLFLIIIIVNNIVFMIIISCHVSSKCTIRIITISLICINSINGMVMHMILFL